MTDIAALRPNPFADPDADGLIRHLGIRWLSAAAGHVRSIMPLEAFQRAPTGAVHGGAIVSLADSTCGYGSFLAKPPAATGFTTLDLNTSFLRAATGDCVTCDARLLHGGRTTHVWDATIRDGEADDGRPLALFRCVQLILYART